jgi:hypothetical protein
MMDATEGKWALHLGRHPDDNTYWLCLVQSDELDAIYPLAQFESEEAMTMYTVFMETQGYTALKLPSQQELDDFLDSFED